MLQVSAVVLQQQHRTEDVGDLRLDEADEPVEHVLERGVEGDHLQHVGLRVRKSSPSRCSVMSRSVSMTAIRRPDWS